VSEFVNQSADPVRPADPAQPKESTEPTQSDSPPRRRGPRRAVRRGTEREAVLGVSADERPAGWGEDAAGGPGSNGNGHSSNDEQLRRDVPPHWG
jgi:hypothetical protein